MSDIFSMVIGIVDEAFFVERISGDAEFLFERPASEVVGASLLDLVAADQVRPCLAALTSASASRMPTNLLLGVHRSGSERVHVQAGFFPLQPVPGVAFVLLPLPGEIPQRYSGVGRVRSLGELTERESEIVTRLLNGDRVPAIAAKLFLSQSTVRNHLASVFAKLGVSSQQQLVDFLRPDRSTQWLASPSR